MIAQARVDTLFVVEALDVAGHGGVEFEVTRVASMVCEFSLERVEEALHVGVVLAVTRPIHAGHDAVGLEVVLVAVGRVLDATSSPRCAGRTSPSRSPGSASACPDAGT